MKKIQLIVEGVADKKFFKDYYFYLFNREIPDNYIVNLQGYNQIENTGINKMRENSNDCGVNLVIVDADKNIDARRKELIDIKHKHNVDFEYFILPNNQDTGALEDLLEKIINPVNQPIMDCWEIYESELKKVNIPTKTPLTIPAKKTKIYAYVETLHGETEKEKKLVKDEFRDFRNTAHWNLDAEYLTPLKDFLTTHINNTEV